MVTFCTLRANRTIANSVCPECSPQQWSANGRLTCTGRSPEIPQHYQCSPKHSSGNSFLLEYLENKLFLRRSSSYHFLMWGKNLFMTSAGLVGEKQLEIKTMQQGISPHVLYFCSLWSILLKKYKLIKTEMENTKSSSTSCNLWWKNCTQYIWDPWDRILPHWTQLTEFT